MAFDGSGVFARLYNWVNDRNAGIKIQAPRMDQEMDGFADGLSNCITRDGQSVVSDDIPFNNKRITDLADATSANDALNQRWGDIRYTGGNTTLTNGTIVESRSSNAATFAIKTLAGSDPSATDPVLIAFPTGSGGYAIRSITAALSITVPSTATLGASNATAFNVWHVLFDDGGTVRFGVINCSTAATIFAPAEDVPASSTAISSSATSAGVFYTGTAVSSKYMRIIGCSHYASGLTTAGTWDSAPTRTVLSGPGSRKPGDVIQVKQTQTTTPGNNNTNTYGNTGFSQSILPTSAANLVRVSLNGAIEIQTGNSLASIRVTRGTSGNTITEASIYGYGSTGGTQDYISPVGISGLDRPASATTLTYNVQLKATSSGNTVFPAQATGTLILEEIVG